MSRNRSSSCFLNLLILALVASAAYGQQVLTETPSTLNLGYTVGSESTVSATFTVTAASSTAYTVAPGASWFTVTCITGTANTVGDTCTVSVVDSAADALSAGLATSSAALSISGNQDSTVTVNLTVSPLVPATHSVSLTYIKNGGSSQAAASQAVAVTDGDSTPDSYTWASSTCPAWILESSAQSWQASSSQADTLTFSVDSTSSTVNGLDAGSGSCIVNLVYASTNVWPFTVNWIVNNVGGSGVSPLSLAVSGSIALTYVKFGGTQTAATSTAVINSTDSTAEAITATFTGTQPPSWLTAVPVSGFTTASSSVPAKVAFTVASGSSGADVATAGSFGPYTVDIAVSGQPALAVTVTVTITAQAVGFTTSSAALSYTTGTSATSITASPVAKSTLGSLAFTSDPTTLPLWLNAVSGTATAAGATVTIQGNPLVLPGMSVGNYSASVGFWATTVPAKALAEFHLTVTLTVSSSVSNISLGTTPAAVIVHPGSTPPALIVTPVSSLGDVGFTIGCAATTTNPSYTPAGTGCTLQNGSSPAGASVTGIAYTWGTPLNLVIDSGLFSSTTPFGTQVLVTVTVSATTNGSTPPSALVYTYNFQPVAATLSAITPPSTVAAGTNPVNVILTGTNFVYPSEIIGGSLAATEVFISTTASTSGVVSAWTRVTANVTVASSGVILVSIPAASLPTFTASATVTKAELYLGVANQTGASAPNTSATGFEPDAHISLDVTTNPVIEAITSTATYVQPNPGSMPNVAPYDLVSIFGANFGATAATIATPDSVYNKYPTSLVVGTSGTGTAAKNITLSVTFSGMTGAGSAAKATTYNAPILFANANQINVIVPSGLNLGTVGVVVSSGTSTTNPASDSFPVNYVAADPGIFTLTSEGTGQGAIVNNSTGAVNGPTAAAVQGTETIEIYMAGLGTPNSTAPDTAITSGTAYPASCVSPASYLTLVNTAITSGTNKYTPPSPAWTGLEGAVMDRVASGLFAPCMLNSIAGTTVTVSFNGGTGQAATYAGFVDDAVAGLYQVNVPVPSGLVSGTGPAVVTLPLTVTIGTFTSPPVNVSIHR